MQGTSTIRVLARFVAEFDFKDLNKEVVREVKRHTLDTLGCALGAYSYQIKPVNIALNFVKIMGGKKESTIIGDGRKIPCANATLINTFLSQVLECNDTHPAVGLHPGQVVIPAALAVAEREEAAGTDVIASIALGYEGVVRLALGISGIHGAGPFSHVYGVQTCGAAVAVGKILRLDEDQMADALAIALSRCLISSEWVNAGLGDGIWVSLNTQNGAYAALLAREGLHGPETIIEGKHGLAQLRTTKYDINKVVDGLGRTFKVSETWFKYYASCHVCHSPIQAAIEGMRKHHVSKEEIQEITVRVSPKASFCCEPIAEKRKPKTPQAAMYSIPYCVAVAILRGNVTAEDFAVKEPETLAITKKINVIADPEFDKYAAMITFKMRDNKVYSYRVNYPKGSTMNPMTDRELQDKFKRLASRTLSKDEVHKIISTINRLEELDSIRELTELIKKG